MDTMQPTHEKKSTTPSSQRFSSRVPIVNTVISNSMICKFFVCHSAVPGVHQLKIPKDPSPKENSGQGQDFQDYIQILDTSLGTPCIYNDLDMATFSLTEKNN